MPAQATVNINANVSPAYAAIQKLVNQQYNLNLNLSTKGNQPLGRITGQLSEFNKSLDAANARVVAFGASATILYGLNKAFESLITSTIEVEKSLADINVILNVSDKQIAKFGDSLFNVAKNTGQSFAEVAKAATEFSRQGLGVEETLKRTSEALILARLSGLDTVKSVEALTAAVNSFASQSVTATQIVNKFATVDAAFAVSSADLAEAISRVGSSASQSGVQLDELIGLVTSAQQTTARGGAVIGNSFKTIFTRLQRGKVVDLLGSLGIETTDASGQLRSTIDLLKDLGKVYDTLGSQQQASVAEAVGGVFQINILKAALSDLGKEYSVYNNAVQISSTATNEAITRNDQLNKTLAAQVNALKQNATQFAAKSGESLFGPALENLVGGGNSLLESLNNVDSESVGGKIGNGILKGLGDIIAGPGLALVGGVLLKLFGDFAKFSAGSVKELLGLNATASQQQGIQASISAILAKNPQLYQQMASGAMSVNQASQVLLTVLQQQTTQMQQQAALTSQISKNLFGAGVRVPKGSQVPVTTKAAGYIPNFADQYAMEEAQAKALGAKNPRAQLSRGTIGGKKFIKNSEEVEIPRFGKNGDSAVIPMYGRGYIPNFAESNAKTSINSNASVLVPEYGTFPNASSVGKNNRDILVTDIPVRGYKKGAVKPAGNLNELIKKQGLQTVADYIKTLQPLGQGVDESVLSQSFLSEKDGGSRGAYGALQGFVGSAFEVAISKSLDYIAAKSTANMGDFDVRGGQNADKLKQLFGYAGNLADFKVSASSGNLLSFADKVIKERGGRDAILGSSAEQRTKRKAPGKPARRKPGFASGYIPNFANALNESISREIGAGVPKSGIYTRQYPELVNSSNPMGVGVFNKRDEGSTSADKRAMSNRGYAKGYIPNFAEGDGTSISSTVTAVGAQLTSFATLLAFQIPNVKRSYQEEIATRKAALIQVTTEEISQRREAAKQLSATQTQERNQLAQEIKDRRAKLKTIQAGGAETLSRGARNASRLQAGAGAAGTALAFAPIIAETVASSIDTTNKEGRVKSAAVTGIGTALSAAGTGALVGSALGPVGTAIGGALGLAVGGLTAWTKALNESRTNLPELQASTKKTSEEQSRLAEVTQAVLPKLEQLQELRQGGNAGSREAVALEKEIRAIASNASPEAQKAISAGGLDFAKTQKNLTDVLKTLSDRLAKQGAAVQSTSIAEAAIGGKINKEQFGAQISKQAISGKTDAELKAMGDELSSATIDLSKLRGALGLTEEQAGKLEQQFGNSWQSFAQDLAKAISEEKRIRLDGARNTAKGFVDRNQAAVKALQDFENKLKKVISSMDIATRTSIATSGAEFASDFKRTKSTGQVDILEALGFEKAASNLKTKNIYQDTIGAQQTKSAADIDEAIKQSLNTAFEKAIPTATGVKDFSQYNDIRGQLGDLSGVTGNQDFSKKIQDISAKIGSVKTNTIQGPLGPLEQYDTEGMISALKENGVKDEEQLNKLRETFNSNNKLLFAAQKDAATKTVQRLDELIKVTIQEMDKLGGTMDQMFNDGGMGDNSVSDKFTEATDNFIAVQKDTTATDEQRGQAASDWIKAYQATGGTIDTSNPMYQMAVESMAKIGQKQQASIEANLAKVGLDPAMAARTVRQTTGALTSEQGLMEAAKVKAGIAFKPTDANIQSARVEQLRGKQSDIISKLGPEGAALSATYGAATEEVNKIPDGIRSLGDVFTTQIGMSNGYLSNMVSILGGLAGQGAQLPGMAAQEVQKGGDLSTIFNPAVGMNSAALMGGRNLLESAPNQMYRERFTMPDAALESQRAQTLPGSPLANPYQGMMLSTQGEMDVIQRQKEETQRNMTQAQAGESSLSFNSPITIAINAASQAQGQQIQQELQGVDQEIIDVIQGRLAKVEAIAAATVTKDPSLNPPPKKPKPLFNVLGLNIT
jgi:TP901 family phage tail tape measure protein